MSNTQRPSTARRVTRKSESNRDSANNDGLSITIDGETHTVRFGDITPTVARQVRQATGMGFMQIVTGIAVSPDVDLIAAFIWVERLLAGERIPLQAIEVDYASIFADDFDVADAADTNDDDEVTGPEA